MKCLRVCKTTALLVCLVGFVIIAFWAGKRYVQIPDERARCRSISGFAQIRGMLLFYHDKHGSFPPLKYRVTPDGPMHSWRVLLLPHMDMYSADLYSKYDFSHEWNRQPNLPVMTRMPGQFITDRKDGATNTNYLAIGEGDEWPSQFPLKALMVTKGEDQFLVVEDPHSEIHWMEPKY